MFYVENQLPTLLISGDIAMKKTFYLDYGRQPQDIFFFSFIKMLLRLKAGCMPKISVIPFLFRRGYLQKHLTGTVPANKEHLTGTVPVNKEHLTGTVRDI